ncbi:glutathione peroxidase, partial [Enterococcus faecium]
MEWQQFFDKFYKVQNFFPYAIPIVLDNEPPR